MGVREEAEDMLKFLEHKQHMEQFMDPEGGYIFMSPDQRRVVEIEVALLRKLLHKE